MDPRSCATIRELLPHYAANQLPPSERAAVERHVATCADCRAELREWLTLGDWLAQADAAIPPRYRRRKRACRDSCAPAPDY